MNGCHYGWIREINFVQDQEKTVSHCRNQWPIMPFRSVWSEACTTYQIRDGNLPRKVDADDWVPDSGRDLHDATRLANSLVPNE